MTTYSSRAQIGEFASDYSNPADYAAAIGWPLPSVGGGAAAGARGPYPTGVSIVTPFSDPWMSDWGVGFDESSMGARGSVSSRTTQEFSARGSAEASPPNAHSGHGAIDTRYGYYVNPETDATGWPMQGFAREQARQAGFGVQPGDIAGWGGTVDPSHGIFIGNVTTDGLEPKADGSNHGWIDITNDPTAIDRAAAAGGNINTIIKDRFADPNAWPGVTIINDPTGVLMPQGSPAPKPRPGPGFGEGDRGRVGVGGAGNGSRGRLARSGEARTDARFPTFSRGSGGGVGGRRKLGVRRSRSSKRRGRG